MTATKPTLKVRADGYAYYGTWSVAIEGRDVVFACMGPGGERPDDARELTEEIVKRVNAYEEVPRGR